jgi:hypothetical protein
MLHSLGRGDASHHHAPPKGGKHLKSATVQINAHPSTMPVFIRAARIRLYILREYTDVAGVGYLGIG